MTAHDRKDASNLELAEDSLIGSLIGDRYRLLELIGKGATGSVYKARHEVMDRLVAVKVMPPALIKDECARIRFEREERAVSRLNHANIVAVHDVGTTADSRCAFLVMDYIEGETLAQAIDKEGQLGVMRCLPIFLQVCGAIEHAHKAGIIHRNIKPANIMLVTQGELEDFVKVVDFGLSKVFSNQDTATTLSAPGKFLGDTAYISPEQAVGEEVDVRSDIYSVGCVLYEALTGKQPIAGKSALDTARRQKTDRPRSFGQVRPDLYIPEWLEAAVFKAIEKNKEDRYPSIQELFDQLIAGASSGSSKQQKRRLSTSLRTAGITDEPSANFQALPARSNRNWSGITIALLLAVVAALAVLLFTGHLR